MSDKREFIVRLDISFTVQAESAEDALELAVYEAKQSGMYDFGYDIEEVDEIEIDLDDLLGE